MDEVEEVGYILRDYDNQYIYAILIFNHYLSKEERSAVQSKIWDLKDEIEEWQVEDIVERLHDYFDFEEQYFDISEKSFEI